MIVPRLIFPVAALVTVLLAAVGCESPQQRYAREKKEVEAEIAAKHQRAIDNEVKRNAEWDANEKERVRAATAARLRPGLC